MLSRIADALLAFATEQIEEASEIRPFGAFVDQTGQMHFFHSGAEAEDFRGQACDSMPDRNDRR